ncbi:MAG: outer-membrane lipoprotein carrier protein LolA [Candidatus Cloacimonetes bacterium]|jgi:outer membrane lipoprotein-sorting protein|nr:outer-membrane lipoprotein carrier protein LolA [Candidatus Cloacimonadota bacterium]
MATYLNKILLFLLLPTLLIANDLTLEKVYDEVLIKYATIYTYETNFTQENYWKEIDVYKSSEGKLYYNREKLLMAYSQPVGQKLLINENSIAMYDPVSEQAIISDKIELELRPDKLISHYWDMSEKELVDQIDDTIKIKLLTPDKERILITISNNMITEFNLVDNNENFVLYKFSNIKINKRLPENIFELNLPEDTSIIDTRNK